MWKLDFTKSILKRWFCPLCKNWACCQSIQTYHSMISEHFKSSKQFIFGILGGHISCTRSIFSTYYSFFSGCAIAHISRTAYYLFYMQIEKCPWFLLMFLCLCEMAAEEFVAKQINWYTIVNLLFIARFLQRIHTYIYIWFGPQQHSFYFLPMHR